ncbi:hypothetical protein EJ110_NYTH05786 [Nymphaea thermarum]|nr:hypothetical protein EJ110_NYTH05786 [Nymphaea thermarum]
MDFVPNESAIPGALTIPGAVNVARCRTRRRSWNKLYCQKQSFTQRRISNYGMLENQHWS